METETEHDPILSLPEPHEPAKIALVQEEKRHEPVEFKHPPHRASPPTSAQHAWMLKHKSTHLRMSHARSAKFTNRGTLHPDGTFVQEALGRPVMDGNGCFGVGIMKIPAKRRR